jgi:hypothetical protein
VDKHNPLYNGKGDQMQFKQTQLKTAADLDKPAKMQAAFSNSHSIQFNAPMCQNKTLVPAYEPKMDN